MHYTEKIAIPPVPPFSEYRGQKTAEEALQVVGEVFGPAVLKVLRALGALCCQCVIQYGDQIRRVTLRDSELGTLAGDLTADEIGAALDALETANIVKRGIGGKGMSIFGIDFKELYHFAECGMYRPSFVDPAPAKWSAFKSFIPRHEVDAAILKTLGKEQYTLLSFIAERLLLKSVTGPGGIRCVCLPLEVIEEVLRVDRPTLWNAIDSLEARGFIERFGEPANYYAIGWEEIATECSK